MNCFSLSGSTPLPPPITQVEYFPLGKPLINTFRLQSLFYLSNYPLFTAAVYNLDQRQVATQLHSTHHNNLKLFEQN